jgi:hypothetical protein
LSEESFDDDYDARFAAAEGVDGGEESGAACSDDEEVGVEVFEGEVGH